MKRDIYYFSGTGNSLWIAREIAKKLEGSNLISIPNIMHQTTEINGDTIGIVCPIYMYNLPHLVVDFIRTIKNAEYIFLVFAGGGSPGSGFKATMKLFRSRNLTLSALFNITLPSNYTPFGATPENEQQNDFKIANTRVDDIVKIVGKREKFIDQTNTSFFESYIHPGLIYQLGYSHINVMDKSFVVDETCTGCSICAKVCPVQNVTMKDSRPTWNHQCQQCYACLQWCPVEAIQYGKKTSGIERYRNPNVTVKDIVDSSPTNR